MFLFTKQRDGERNHQVNNKYSAERVEYSAHALSAW